MKRNSKLYCCIMAALLAYSVLVPVILHAKPINLFGNWKAYFQGQEEEATTDGLVQFRQMYNATWNPLVTGKMSFVATMGYNNNWIDDLGTREQINPSFNFGVSNDLFSFGLNGDILQSNISFRDNTTTTTWNSTLSSSWNNYLWPHLAIRGGQQYDEIANLGGGEQDNETYSYLGASITWEVYKFKLFYDYNISMRDLEKPSETTQEDIVGHLAKLEYFDSFLDNRLMVTFSQLYFDTTREVTADGDSSLLQVPVTSARSGIDITPESGVLPLNQALIDGNRNITAISVQLQQPVNLAVRTNFNRVDKLYVYTKPDDRLLVADTNAVTWDLYTSSNGVSWQLVTTNVPSSFNGTDFRFEISTGTQQAQYVKLVVTGWIPTLDLDITEIEAFALLSGETSDDFDLNSKNYKTELYLGMLPFENTRFNYSFSWDRTESSGQNESKIDQLIQTARLGWDYSRYFMPSVGFTSIINNNDRPEVVDTETRSYDLQISSTPISTIDLGFTASVGEYFEDDERDQLSSHLSLSVLAAVYPDLSTELSVGYNKTRNEITEEENDGLFASFIVHSRLRKNINLDLQTSYGFANSDSLITPGAHLHGSSIFENTSSEGGETLLTANWIFTDVLLFSMRGYTTYRSDTDNQYGAWFSTNYQIFSSAKTNLSFSYQLNVASDKDTVNNFGLVWGWDISNHFTLNTSGNYIIEEDESSWNLYSQLTAKF